MGKKITLACDICHNRNYSTEKNSNLSERLEIKKFCKNCKQHTIHRETK